ncbi:leukocyte elastase inhibitor-like [Anopheles cruzii]|uniref:leukocyte elastase inhibitor-like n=1 Tax=Anopheles cruzii TaxID=68878 RepID=UPI0022EC7937|nr:leukocyte elastase inhibitor-like [Anopheles cruzii]
MSRILGLLALVSIVLSHEITYTGTVRLTKEEFCRHNGLRPNRCDKRFEEHLKNNPHIEKCPGTELIYSNFCSEFKNEVTNAVDLTTDATSYPPRRQPNFDEYIEVPPSSSRVPVEKKVMEFSLQLFKTAAFGSSPAGNFILSPVMVQMLLAYLIDGASNISRAELKSVLQLTMDDLKELQQTLKPDAETAVVPKYKLDIASQIFKSTQIELLPAFQESLKRNKVPLQEMDFSNRRVAVNEINHWVNVTTRQRITSIVDENSLDPDTQLMLLNAIYFNGSWQYSFNRTVPRATFHLNENTRSSCNMMVLSRELRYGNTQPDHETHGLYWIELPYTGDTMSMILLLPNERFQLDRELQRFQAHDLENILSEIRGNIKDKIKVNLPMFKADSTVSLVEPLKKMGLSSVFGTGNPFDKLSNTAVKISDVRQKSFLTVNMHGTVATSVTTLTVIPLSISRTMDFIADQPFAAIIVDKQKGIPLFIARISKPTKIQE